MNLIEAMQMFVAVVEHGSYTKAAEALNVHRPALSKLIQNLEHELGVQLLHRTTRRVNTTPAGDEFYERSLKLLSDLADTLDWFSPTRSAARKAQDRHADRTRSRRHHPTTTRVHGALPRPGNISGCLRQPERPHRGRHRPVQCG